MNLKKYQELALRTENKKLDYNGRILNCAFGLSGEFGEICEIFKKCYFHQHPIDFDNLKKELGDLIWYAVVLADVFNINFDETFIRKCNKDLLINMKVSPDSMLSIMLLKTDKNIGEFSKYVMNSIFLNKKLIYFNKTSLIIQIISNTKKICNILNQFTFDEVIEENIKKLKSRYPNGFSSKASINRNDVGL